MFNEAQVKSVPCEGVPGPLVEAFCNLLKVQQLQLNFTHRSAHGGNDDADVQHGEFDQLAV